MTVYYGVAKDAHYMRHALNSVQPILSGRVYWKRKKTGTGNQLVVPVLEKDNWYLLKPLPRIFGSVVSIQH